MKHLNNFLSALLLCAIVGTAIAHLAVVDPVAVVLSCVAISFGYTVAMSIAVAMGAPAPKADPNTLAVVALYQMWETALIEAFRASRNWASKIPRKDDYVGNNVINLTEIGADPNVLINNTVYPIASAQRTDDNIILALNKYDTENTTITRDELYAIPYDKEGSVIRQHRNVLIERTAEHGLYTMAPAGNTANTPVIETTGADNGNSRRRLKSADLIRLKERLDTLKVPAAGRVLVLCSAHVSDLLVEDQSFNLRYNGQTERGTIITMLYGFEIFEDVYNPRYDASNARRAFAAAPAGTDRNASTLFFAPRAFQAAGTVEMFASDKKENPTMRRSEIGFQMYNVIAPMKNIGFGAIVSDDLL